MFSVCVSFADKQMFNECFICIFLSEDHGAQTAEIKNLTNTVQIHWDVRIMSLNHYEFPTNSDQFNVCQKQDLLNGAKGDTAQVKRIVLACERDMEEMPKHLLGLWNRP